MLKNILNLEGAQKLSNNEQKEINGGITKQCADTWYSHTCFTTTVNNCFDPNGDPGVYACGKCCY